MNTDPIRRAERFCERFGGCMPILLAPMAGACPPALSIEIMKAGGWGAAGCLLMQPEQITAWADNVRSAAGRACQLNAWIPEPSRPLRHDHEAALRQFLSGWCDPPALDDAAGRLPDFDAQCEAMLAARPAAISSIMGVFSAEYVAKLKAAGVSWMASVTTVAEAKTAQAAGADVIVAQGMEAGGHRGVFDERAAEATQVGLFSLLPHVVDAVDVPVVASGGIADARGIAAAFMLGASAVQIGTGFLRCPESDIPSAWKDAIGRTWPEDTVLTRAYTGRAGRAIATAYARAASRPDAPKPAPYPWQRMLTQPMTAAARSEDDIGRMQAWAGQSGALAGTAPAAELTRSLWQTATELLSPSGAKL
ncbi:nitronate monooxygenase [Rhodothalassium salexigens]|uniref:NAD(P)H-dependent flavin oxidoreductase n=1 Tax=Rhodothalassium salexigens TaxID=1086 RepID=UPI001912ED4D|nr:nitronate monooxygenase [Rhodothalassium salexigens]MBK5912491.1 nitronate monooxygenase [Rhodothalassium salexigens]